MKPYQGELGSVGWSVLSGRASWRRLYAMAVALLLLLATGASPTQARPSAPAASTAHVYLLRGVLNIFSLGLDDIAAQLRAQGIPVTVANFASWSSLADEAAAALQERPDRDDLFCSGVPGRDRPARHGRRAGPAWRSLTGYRPGFGVSHQALGTRWTLRELLHRQRQRRAGHADRQFQGKLGVLNVQNVPGVGHMSMRKRVMQRKVIAEIDAVVFGRSARGRKAGQRRETGHGKHRSGTRSSSNAVAEATNAANSSNSSAINHP